MRLLGQYKTCITTVAMDTCNAQETDVEGLVTPTPLLRDFTTPLTRVKASPPVKGAMEGSTVAHQACERLLENNISNA